MSSSEEAVAACDAVLRPRPDRYDWAWPSLCVTGVRVLPGVWCGDHADLLGELADLSTIRVTDDPVPVPPSSPRPLSQFSRDPRGDVADVGPAGPQQCGRCACGRALSRFSSKLTPGAPAAHRPPKQRPLGSGESGRLQRRPGLVDCPVRDRGASTRRGDDRQGRGDLNPLSRSSRGRRCARSLRGRALEAGFSPVSSAELDPNGPRARESPHALDARNAAVAAVRSGGRDTI